MQLGKSPGCGRSFLSLLNLSFYRLNGLTVANRIHILEPQWNPTVEAQAIGRVVRLGQEEKVTVIRYAMTHSIEEVGILPRRQSLY